MTRQAAGSRLDGMRIKVRKTGRVFPTAQWFGFGFGWIRAWDGADGFYHFWAPDVVILEDANK